MRVVKLHGKPIAIFFDSEYNELDPATKAKGYVWQINQAMFPMDSDACEEEIILSNDEQFLLWCILNHKSAKDYKVLLEYMKDHKIGKE